MSIIYNIPTQFFEAYRGRKVIVRAHDPAELVRHLSKTDLENVLYLQLLSLNADIEALTHWGESVPIDILLRNPAEEFSLLYNFSNLLDKHPVRATISVRPGFSRAVILALALNFAVKLEVGQPGPAWVEELAEILDRYLHRPTVAQAVEYFHSTFLSFYHQEPSSLWLIQEEDPEQFRFITDEGEEAIPQRFAAIELSDSEAFLSGQDAQTWGRRPSECDDCEFLAHCGGYFKWPDKAYSCEGVKMLFRTLKEAAQDLRNDLDAFQAR